MGNPPIRRRVSSQAVPHPNSPAGRNFDWPSLGVRHPDSPAGRNFNWSALGAETIAAVLRRWSTYIGTLDLRVPANRGALWSKLFDEPSLPKAAKSALSDGDVATALAAQDGRLTLESKLATSDFWQHYRTEFPDVNAKPVWDDRTIGIWKMLSEKYASGLEGDVVAYVDSDEVINSINEGKPPILTNELAIISAQVRNNGKITSVTFQDVWTCKRTKALSRQTLQTGFKFFN